MQVALNYLLLNGNEVDNIARAVLVEQSLNLSYCQMAKEVLGYLCEVELELISI